MSKKGLKATDPARFEGNGISYRAKIIGTEDVPEARGDAMCQEMIQTLKTGVKTSGQHKKRVFINVTLEGLKIIDGTSMSALHTHPVHQISFISRDVTDSRAFGYIFGPGDGTHKFFGIKTANAAENLVLALRDLFQTVYEMKKQEMDDAKAKAAAPEGDEAETLNTATAEPVEGQESIYQVPKNNAPVNPQEQEEAVANLLDLEDQVDNILKGIEQIKNLEFDELTSEEAPRQPVTPTSPTATSPAATSPTPAPPTLNDPWGSPAPAAAPSVPASSSLSDLQTLANPPPPTANPFGGMPGFAPAGGMGAPGFGQPAMGQPRMFAMPGQQPGMPPVLRDPFGNDPFRTQVPPHMMGGAGQTPFPQQQQPAFGAAPFAPHRASPVMGGANPFPMGGQPGFGGMPPPAQQGFPPAAAAAPFGMMAPPGGMGMGMGMHMQAPPPSQGANLFPQEAPEDNLLQPLKPGGGQGPETAAAAPKSDGREALFGDLLDIKKSTGGADMAAKSPKEMFQELSTPPKKSLNQIKSGGPAAAPAASQASGGVVIDQDPFAEDPFGSLDSVLRTVAADDTDPFVTVTSSPSPPGTSLPPPPPPSSSSAAPPPPLAPPSLPPQPPAPPDPFAPNLILSAPSSKESSPEAHFQIPDEPPPPLPQHLKVSLAAPSPPPRPPPIPSRPMPKSGKTTTSSSSSSPVPSQPPPPLPSTPRPLGSAKSSSSSSSLASEVSASGASTVKRVDSDSRDTRAEPSSSPSQPSPQSRVAPPSPTPSWDSLSTLSHSSSQKSLDRTAAAAATSAVVVDPDDPFGVPLRSKRSFSSADGASKRSSRSSGKLSVKSVDQKVSAGGGGVALDPFGVALDPFGVPFGVTDRTSCEGSASSRTDGTRTDADNPFSVSAASDSSAGAPSSEGKWEAFGDHAVNGLIETIKTNGQKSASPFGDSFGAPVNGKPTDAQS